MGSDLEVDVEGLGQVAAALVSVRDGLDDTRAAVDALESVLGSSDVARALDDFENNWDDGRGQIKENMEGLISVLQDSAQAYRDTDQSLVDALQPEEASTTVHQAV